MYDDTNEHVRIVKLQGQIRDYLGLSEGEAIFEYSTVDGGVTLNLVTINPDHNQSFLFQSTRGVDKASALSEMLQYVQSYREKENTYTIQWAVRGSNRLETSYFRGKDIYDVLHKFTYGRDRNTTQVYSISLNPIT